MLHEVGTAAFSASAPVGRQQVRRSLARAAMLLLLAVSALPRIALAFDFDDVAKAAEQLAGQPWKKPAADLPRELASLSYQQYRDIRYRPEGAMWRAAKLPFELTFVHEGFNYDQPVRISEVSDKGPAEARFDPAQFDYGGNKLDTSKFGALGYAGFRVHHAMNGKGRDEVLSFVGASYFRAVGKDQRYGVSARGLAIDTGLPSGEEFPRFVEFWIERPAPEARELVIYGLLDSRRVAGAYRFILRPGVETAIEVKARLYLREGVGKFGVAPLTSMFFYGENQRPGNNEDYRPEVHDSDGLLLHAANDEWIWRPLQNPRRLLVTSFATANPIGFGLMQRDREFARYEDLEARYDRRPSAWVEPKGSWGAGRVELVQIPSPDESNDNIVAYWVPDVVPAPKQPWDVEYRLLWQKDTDTRPPHAWVTQTRRGHGAVRSADGTIGMVLDFDGPLLRKLPPEAKVEGVVSTDASVEVVRRHTYRNDATGGWRMALELRRVDGGKAAELRAFLRMDNNPVSETWSYVLPAD
jgi:glucans biosynthesis protein